MDKRYPVTMMCAACVPWTQDMQFDEAAFRKQVRHLVDHDVKSIYTFGTAGEGYAVNGSVFTQVTRALLDECGQDNDVMPMTGIIGTSLMEMRDRIETARNLGCRDFQIALPCWGALSDDEVLCFFDAICSQFKDCRFIHYNNGPRSKRLCTIDLYTRLAERFENLAAVKYSTHNMLEIYDIAATDCPITFYLVDGGYTFGAMVGTCGFLNSFASIDMDLAWKYFFAGQEKNHKVLIEFYSYYKELVACFDFIKRPMIDAGYDKAIEKVADHGFNHSLYPPYKGLTSEEFETLDTKMKNVILKYKQII